MTLKMQTIAILGRQPALGLAELESLYGAEHIKPFGKSACLLDIKPADIGFNRLGGVMRLAEVITELPSQKWVEIEKYLLDTAPEQAQSIDGKLSFGISVFGLAVNSRQIAKTALLLKKAIKAAGNSVRMVPQKDTTLGTAQVLYNKLTAKNGWELLVVSNKDTALLARTTNIQDIDAYSARDQARPKRDAKVGMLPPKLAQILINLASASTKPNDENIVLDPFCGTGVVLQEASLMGFGVSGTDIDPRMVDYSIANMSWLRDKYPDKSTYLRIEIGDATKFSWTPKPTIIAAETFLGHPLSSLPNGEHLSKIIYEANLINHRFLQNIASQLNSGNRLCLGVPAWRGKHEFLHLPMLDHLTEMGYTRVRFEHASNEELIYHRENQIVGRELLTLVKN